MQSGEHEARNGGALLVYGSRALPLVALLLAAACEKKEDAPFAPTSRAGAGAEDDEDDDEDAEDAASEGDEPEDEDDVMTLVSESDAQGTDAFYIDAYEAIVIGGRAFSREGVVPTVRIDFAGAELACENADKRICTFDEWLAACLGPRERYAGPSDDPEEASELCDVARTSNNRPGSLPSATGSHPDCKTDGLDVWDMIGNASEWTWRDAGAFPAGVAFYMPSYGSVCETGLTELNGDPVPAGEKDTDIGFRCCRDAR